MVHIQSEGFYDAARRAEFKSRSNDAREYWMLQNESNGLLGPKRRRLDERNAKYNVSASRSQLEKLCLRAEQGLYIYDKVPVLELRTFISARQLSCKVPLKTKRADLVAILERADEERTFPFLKLPPELRVQVFQYHFRTLQTRNGHLVTLPPLTAVSKLVRKESMPLFYETCTFHLDIIAPDEWLRAINQAENDRYFAPANATRLRGIRKLQVEGSVGPYQSGTFVIEMGGDGKVAEVRHVKMDTLQVGAAAQSWLDRAEEGLKGFRQRLINRRENKVMEDTSGGDRDSDSRVVEFVEGPVAGLDLQSSDLAVLKGMFRPRSEGK
ncbi:uncharacterized protein RCC_11169 [Ramularia collo-cygni]|uniref:F-box domain-containing protein n=1 Tax=Ramularia collo-cygni TaxID=112498 RepID=A0A2D3V587_9PEZI|nr:uncharacterized protein RCC_11169 [Ramularia collo-cygni]CZT25437.1 uncharacterized protein RCC_11169 [Ramularia collo-cygni]